MRKVHLAFAVFFALSILALPSPSSAQVAVGISVRIGPPPLPVYAQPICPGSDYIWAPGYWAWGPDGYYWVPGTWVLAPEPGYLWTPGYWAFADGFYVWHPGYWGPQVGFYGGINYGYGYFGVGYVGGEWRGRTFYYNRAVSNVNVSIIRHVYVNRTVVRNEREGRISFNGGPHGIDARPTREQMRYDRERHLRRTNAQERHEMDARQNRAFRYSDNHGRPPVGATQRPGEFRGREAAPPQRSNQQYRQQARPQGRPGVQRPREEAAPRGNARPQERRQNEQPRSNPRPQERRQNEQPRGNGRSDRGHGRSGDHGNDQGGGHGRQ